MRVLNSKERQVVLVNVYFAIAMGVGVATPRGRDHASLLFGTLFLLIGQSFGRAIKKKEEFTNSP